MFAAQIRDISFLEMIIFPRLRKQASRIHHAAPEAPFDHRFGPRR